MRGGGGSDPTPTPQRELTIVTPTPLPPGATVAIPPTPTIDPSTLRRHTVQPGETLSSIAAQYGVTETAIQQLNGITDPDSIQAGQVLLIPPAH